MAEDRGEPGREREDRRADGECHVPAREQATKVRGGYANSEQAGDQPEEEGQRNERTPATAPAFRRAFHLRPDKSDDPYARRDGAGSGARREKSTDGGQPLQQSALELVTSVDKIAGQIKGVGGDRQFRLYVTLVPDAQKVLTRASEFFRDKDNTVFHKEYPINFRQRGRVPTIQISIAKDGTRAEYEVFKRFSELVRGRMAVIISHRFSTVRIADRIIVLDDGAVVEKGTHAELLAKDGLYPELFTLQAEGYR